MRPTWFESIGRRLADADCQGVIAGGVAAFLHGNPRLTMDLDLYIDWSSENLARVVKTLTKAGYHSVQPVDIKVTSSPESKEGCQAASFLEFFHGL